MKNGFEETPKNVAEEINVVFKENKRLDCKTKGYINMCLENF